MTTPERSSAIARALAAETEALPATFAKEVAALAEARAAAHPSNWPAVAMCCAFAGMVVVCVLGWMSLGTLGTAGPTWFAPILETLARQIWLVVGPAGFVSVQALTFRRRTRT